MLTKQYVLITLIAVFMTSMMTVQQVQATSFFENLGNKIDSMVDNGKQGYNDGKSNAVIDYPKFNSKCPSDSDSYCVGYIAGYIRGWDAKDAIK